MPRYEILAPCYIPVGNGTKFKYAGATVTLTEDEAADLKGYVQPITNGRAFMQPWAITLDKPTPEPEPEPAPKSRKRSSEPEPSDGE